MKAFAHAAVFTGLSTLTSLFVGLARTKLVAVTLGVEGVGFLSQVQTTLSFAAELVSVGFGNAIVRTTASAASEGNPRRASTLFSTAYLAALAFSLVVAAGLFVLPSSVFDGLFGLPTPTLALAALAIAVPFTAVGAVERAITQGLRNVRLLASANIIAALLGLAVLVPLVLAFGVAGALIHVAAFSAITYLVFVWARRRATRSAGFDVAHAVRPTLAAARALASYGSANAVAGIARAANLVFIRAFIIATLGIHQNGIYQAVWAIPSLALSLVLNTLSTYAFPLVSGQSRGTEASGVLNTSLRFALLTATPLIAVLIVGSQAVVLALYSPEFAPAGAVLPLQLAGELFKAIAWALGLSLLARGHLVAFTLLDLTWNALFALGVLVLAPRVGLWGVAASYAGAYVVHALATYLFQRRREAFRLTSANTRLVASSGVLVLGAVAIARLDDQLILVAATSLGGLAWLWLGTLPGERATAVRWVRRWLRVRFTPPLSSLGFP